VAELLIKDKIREKANPYSLLLEGGGGEKPDRA
jgi:hypothetical protein